MDLRLLLRVRSTPCQNEVSVTTTLSTKKHETGFRSINNYILGKELGQGTSGEVHPQSALTYPPSLLTLDARRSTSVFTWKRSTVTR